MLTDSTSTIAVLKGPRYECRMASSIVAPWRNPSTCRSRTGGPIGLGAALAIGRFAASLLYQLQGYDPTVLAGSGVALTMVALGAGFMPALRASQIGRAHV